MKNIKVVWLTTYYLATNAVSNGVNVGVYAFLPSSTIPRTTYTTPPARTTFIKPIVKTTNPNPSKLNAIPFDFDPSLIESSTSIILSHHSSWFHEMMPSTNNAQFNENFLNSNTLLLSHDVAEHHTPTITNIPFIDNIFASTTFWSVSVMLTIISLLLTWEQSVHTLRQNIPKPLTPVLDSMLGEIGGIGFIGLLLDIFATSDPDRGLGNILSTLSEEFLGEEEILLETFEALHKSFFEVGIGFFLVIGTVVYAVISRINDLSDVSRLALDTNGDGDVCLNELADALNVQPVNVDLNGDGDISNDEISNAISQTKQRSLIEEVTLSVEQRASEILLIRQSFLQQHKLDKDFKIERYFEQIFAYHLEEMVELSPLTWLPLIPLISLGDSIVLSHDVISGSSANAALYGGCFITTPWFVIPSLFLQGIGLVWCFVNYWKIKEVKDMLIPTLVRDTTTSTTRTSSRDGEGVIGTDVSGLMAVSTDRSGSAIMLPPRYKDDTLRNALNTSPGPLAFIERLLCKGGERQEGQQQRYTNNHEYLFGAAGKDGPEIYRFSIKLHTWLCVAQIVFIFGQIVLPDFYTLLDYNKGILAADDIGDLDWLLPEFTLFSSLVLVSIAQLFLKPSVFLNYCTATSIEEMTKSWALEKAKENS